MNQGISLTLSRKESEEICFSVTTTSGEVVEFKQVFRKISGNHTKVTIEAPDSVKVLRGELVG